MILDIIRQLYPQLTKSQRRLADFIATSYQETAFMTASQLASRLAVNEATVVRFAQRLGYAGYPELIGDIQAVVQGELGAKGELIGLAGEEPSLLDELAHEVEALQRVASHITPEVAREAQKALREAHQVHVLGEGLSAPLAQLLCFSLRALGILAQNPPADPLSLAILLDDLDESATLVVILAASESLEIASALRLARQKGARTLALSWSPLSACAQAAELALTYPTSDAFTLPSIGVGAALIDALVQSLATSSPEAARSRMERLEETRALLVSRRH